MLDSQRQDAGRDLGLSILDFTALFFTPVVNAVKHAKTLRPNPAVGLSKGIYRDNVHDPTGFNCFKVVFLRLS